MGGLRRSTCRSPRRWSSSRGSAIAASPRSPASGRRTRSSPRRARHRRLRRSGRRHVAGGVHRLLHDAPDLRLLRQRAVAPDRPSVPRRRRRRPHAAERRRPPTTSPDRRRRRPVRTTSTAAAARVATDHDGAHSLLAGLALDHRLHQHALPDRPRLLATSGSSRRFPASRCTSRRRSSRARALEGRRWSSPSSGSRSATCATGTACPTGERPARPAARAARPGARARATTSTKGSRAWSTGRCAVARFLEPTASSTRGSSTAPSTASAKLVKLAGGLATCRTGSCATTRSASPSAPSRRALYLLVGGAVSRGRPRSCPSIIARRSSARSSHVRAGRRPEIAKAVGYAATMITFGLARLLSALRAQRPVGSSSSRTSRGSRPRRPLPRRGRRHQPVHGRAHRPAVPARAARVGALHRATGSRRTSRGSCSSRGDLGVFLSLDLILFFVFWEIDARPDVLPHPRMGAAADRATQRRSSSCTPMAGSAFLLADDRRSGSCTRPTPAASRSTSGPSPRWTSGTASRRHGRGAAVPRVHGRVRDQGAAVPVPHVAARRAHRGADRGLGGAGRRHPEDGRLRLRALLVRAVPASAASTWRRSSSSWR